ncbi:MAG TPA: thiamine biosynthesis protein ApbE [Prevotella sp.]|nr:FAD:protein FMN transferase [uncultured Prevotella sp.]HBF05436.1 thiamine biosynthesis protein ApbE [Candidatus Segatella violae]
MKNKKLIWQVPFLMVLLIGTIIIIRQQHDTPYQKDTGFVFGTIYHITYQSDENYQKEIEAELKKVDQSLSPFNNTSIISRINRNENVEVNGMFKEVFTLAESISKDTQGAFDITVAPMVNLWGFGFKHGVPPTQEKLDSIRALVGYQKVSLKDGHIYKQHPQTMLDCSAIAKGYGSDVVAKFLKKKGILNYMVEIGGEIVVSGVSDKQVPWHIGINKPTDDSTNTNQELQDVLDITDIAMATSGNYRNFYYKNGKKYAHTIDPKTGYPVQHNILSATVLAKDCATADAYATSFMVMGMDGTKKILERHPELCAYLIYSDAKGNNKIWYSPSIQKKILNK